MSNKTPIPPKLARRFLQWFLRDDLAEEVMGDLDQQFSFNVLTGSLFRARLRYWYEVLRYLRPFAMRKQSFYRNNSAMLKNYFKVSWRNLIRHKMYSSIKIGGFGLGIAACLLIGLFIRNELTYDKHYPNGERIYRITRENTFQGETGMGAHFPYPFAAVVQAEYPDIELAGRYNAVALFGAGSNEVRRADKTESLHEDKLIFIDQTLLDIFQVPFLYGNPKSALENPNSMVITKSRADKYFPGEEPLGKTFILNNDEAIEYEITGVIPDFPDNSHFCYDFLISLADRELYPGEAGEWRNDNYLTYVLLKPGTEVNVVEQKLSALIDKYFLPPRLESARKDEIDWVKSMKFHLQPVDEIYLNQIEIREGLVHGDIRYIWLFGAIAVFILIIACINFINLSTARSANRAKEVGLRKVVGSHRGSLIKQFLSESLLFSCFAFVIGVVMAWLLLPYFNALLDKSLDFPLGEWWFLPVLLTGVLVVGIVAGVYPAVYLSSFRPVQVLKGNMSRGSKNSSMRSALVVFQFTISIVLIVGTLITQRQMDFILNKKLGFDKEQVLVLQGTHTLGNRLTTLKTELLRLPQVKSASISSHLPVEGFKRDGGGWRKEGMSPEEAVSGQQWAVDRDYVKTLEFNIVLGRDFSQDSSSDSTSVIINQTMALKMNFEDPIGEQISNWLGKWTIIGVVEDFHHESMKEEIEPVGMYLRPSTRALAVKVNTNHMEATINDITEVWKELSPNQAIRYTFLDQQYDRMYRDVERISTIFTVFALLAVVIACLGLFALSSFLVEQRGKEISIRLVLGASVNSILQLLTGNFLRLVTIALLIATPIAYLMMQRWLEDFVYRIDLGWGVFVVTSLIAILIALSTTGYQALKAAIMNPVENLRSE